VVKKPFQFQVMRPFSIGDKIFKRNKVFTAVSRPFVRDRVEMLYLTFEDGLAGEICCEFVKFFEEEVKA
jgi:hypothetical protein